MIACKHVNLPKCLRDIEKVGIVHLAKFQCTAWLKTRSSQWHCQYSYKSGS